MSVHQYVFQQLTEKQLQAYGNLVSAVIQLTNADKTAKEGLGLPAIAEAISLAVEANKSDSNDSQIEDLKDRLGTLFALVCPPSKIAHPEADVKYLVSIPVEIGTALCITIAGAFTVTAGYLHISGMEWPKIEQRWLVVSSESTIGKSLKPLVGHKSMAGKPMRGKQPYNAPIGFIGVPMYGFPEKVLFREDNKKASVEISIEDEKLYIWRAEWAGNFRFWLRQAQNKFKAPYVSIERGTIGINTVVKAEASVVPSKQHRSEVLDERLLDQYLCKDKYEVFWTWFHQAALRGFIAGDEKHLDRASWFYNRKDTGVRLMQRTSIGDLQRFLGFAEWRSIEEDRRLSFSEQIGGKFLCGSLQGSGNDEYIKLFWENIRFMRSGWKVNEKLLVGKSNVEINSSSTS